MEFINEIIENVIEENAVQVNLPAVATVLLASNRNFIEANTVEGNLSELQNTHLIPVFVKDNQPLISHAEFISTTQTVVQEFFEGQILPAPSIRLSHEIKGRIPSARDKPANQLEEWEKTLYYERMMFCIEIPGVTEVIDGNTLCLTVGGVKSYTQDNLYGKKGGDEHFKLFVGFKNRVCTNLCVFSDGLVNDLKVTSVGQLRACIISLLESYNRNHHLFHLNNLAEYFITEQQFALLIGRCRMYPYLPVEVRKGIPQLQFGDSQLVTIVKDYYRDSNFCRDEYGSISLWKLYNLFTGANKSSYIDRFLDKSINAYNFVEQIKWELEGKTSNWYLS